MRTQSIIRWFSQNRAMQGVGILALTGFVLVWGATQKYGIGLGSDAAGYIQTAREILAGQGVSPAFTLQPPLYPATLAWSGLVTFSDPLDAAVWAHAVLFAGVIFISGVLFVRHLPRFPLLALLGTLGVLTSPGLVNVALTAFSELEFILLVSVSLLAIERYAESFRARWLVLAIGMTAGACLTRYLGVTLVGAGTIALMWLLRANRKRAISSAAAFAIVSALPLALWAVRNVMVSGAPFGARAAGRFTLFDNLYLTLETFAGWFAPEDWTRMVWSVLVILMGLSVWNAVTGTHRQSAHRTASLAPHILFGVFYTVFLLFTASTTGLNRIGTRLLSPIFIPAWLIGLVWLDRVLDLPRSRISARWVNVFALTVVALALVVPVQQNRSVITRAVAQGAGGYNTTRWRTSETVQYVQAHRAEFSNLVLTNGPDVLYILGGVNGQSIPPKFEYASNERANDANALRGTYPPETATLVWFDRIERDDFLFSLEELQGFTQLTRVEKLRDGAIYRMEKIRSGQ